MGSSEWEFLVNNTGFVPEKSILLLLWLNVCRCSENSARVATLTIVEFIAKKTTAALSRIVKWKDRAFVSINPKPTFFFIFQFVADFVNGNHAEWVFLQVGLFLGPLCQGLNMLYCSLFLKIKIPRLCIMFVNKFQRLNVDFIDMKVEYWPNSKSSFIQ